MALDFGKLNFSTSFNPTSAFPIDARTYFESLTAAQAAAASAETAGSSNTTYYIGQIFTVYEGGEVAAYQVTAAKALQKLASTTASGDLASDVAALQSQVGALQASMTAAEGAIEDIKDGTTVVAKATADADGNVISEHYATKDVATTGAAGLMSATDKAKLDGVEAGAEVNVIEGVAVKSTASGEFTPVSISGKVAQVDLSGIDSDITALEGRMTTAEGEIDTLQTQVAGLTGAMHFVGTSTTDPVEEGATISGHEEFESGDVCFYDGKEYIYDGSAWQEFGNEGEHLTKEVADTYYVPLVRTVNGKALSANISLTAENVGADPAGTAAGLVAGLDVAAVIVGAGETIASISETDGKIAVTKQAIAIEQAAVNGLTGALAAKADATAVTAVEENVTDLQGRMTTAEGEIDAIQAAGYQNAAQVTGAIANATIEASKINGVVANASYATQAGALINSITLNVAGTEHQFNGGEAVSINITAAGLGALTAVPVATNEALGGIKVGFTSAGENYAVQLDANNAAYVTVPVPEVASYNGVGAISITANGANYDVAVAANGILTSMIADGQITTAKIAANAVTKDKIASVTTDVLEQGAQELVLNGGTSAD